MVMKKKVPNEKTLNYAASFQLSEGQLFKMNKTYYSFVRLITDKSGASWTAICVAYDCKKNDYVALSMEKHGNKEITIIP